MGTKIHSNRNEKILYAWYCIFLLVFVKYVQPQINLRFMWDMSSTPVILKVCSMDPLGSTTNSQGIHCHVSVMATIKFTCLLTKGTMFC